MAWQGRILRVDLDAGTCEDVPLRRAWCEAYIGLRGLGSRQLVELGAWRHDPLAPAAPLIFATGPLTGTSAATAGRYAVLARGPLTGAIACSNSGGHFGAALKFAGYDMIVITGRAAEPVHLWIDDERAELRPATDLWGRSFWETEAALRDRHGHDVKVAGIGRAGELGVRYACVMNDRDRAAGRSGVGAVMGAKNLKAIAVRGTGGLRVHDVARFADVVQATHARLAAAPGRRRLMEYGTDAMMSVTCAFGALPTRNARDVTFAGCENISAEAMRRAPGPGRRPNLVRNRACFACTIGCGRIARIRPDHFTAAFGERYRQPQGGLEYESAYALGAMVGVDDLDAVTFANMVCNEQGMDPISFGATLAAAMELFETGILDAAETGGVELRFGDARALVAAVRATGEGEGPLGALLGEGAARLCARFGHPELAMVVKGQEFPGYDPRAMQGMGLAYATSPRGACHLRADPYRSDFETPDPAVKPRIVRDTQDEHAAID
ncbi:MAG TPA: aldehyde ferredoxin oxidoreductase, partial [Thermopetrobacter sp.]|nr:aldehyde ferredoxin oxidoreductase [Thermopetrobacter sp.]